MFFVYDELTSRLNFFQDGSRFAFSPPFSYIHFHISPSPVPPTGFSFYIFSGFLAMFILFSFNNNNIISAYI